MKFAKTKQPPTARNRRLLTRTLAENDRGTEGMEGETNEFHGLHVKMENGTSTPSLSIYR